MKKWECKEHNIEIFETELDYDLHMFKVYRNDELIGTIVPNSIEDMQACISGLNDGECPICDRWEDGFGHTCNEDGWLIED